LPALSHDPDLRSLRVAIVHYWLVNMRGGEKVVEALCEIFPQADLFTHVYDPLAVSETIRRHRVFTTSVARLPFARGLYQKYLPFMPAALEQIDLRGYDLVLSSESGPAKGVLTTPAQVHVCYCHTPMRYLWDMYPDYYESAGPFTRFAMRPVMHWLRQWDLASSFRVDHFIANSAFVGARIAKHYRREATVIHPPVDVDEFAATPGHDDFYLCLGQLVGYKRVDLAIDTFRTMPDRRLVIIGEGDLGPLPPNVRWLGRLPFDGVKDHLQRCRALVFPGEEDFGIVPVEAMACGKPVLAFGRGGARETVIDGTTGLLFHEQTTDALRDVIERFETESYRFDAERIRMHAQGFAKEVFQQRMSEFVSNALTRRVR
jgi:glycosyltransferase involved in cell wall biosynthesis